METPPNLIISPFSVQAGVLATYIVYNSTLIAGSAAAQTASAGMNLIGMAASLGTTYIAGNIAGATVASMTTYCTSVTKRNIDSGTQIAAVATGVAAGAGTLVACTASILALKGIVIVSRKTIDAVRTLYQHDENYKDRVDTDKDKDSDFVIL
jgi:hypothetical protein